MSALVVLTVVLAALAWPVGRDLTGRRGFQALRRVRSARRRRSELVALADAGAVVVDVDYPTGDDQVFPTALKTLDALLADIERVSPAEAARMEGAPRGAAGRRVQGVFYPEGTN